MGTGSYDQRLRKIKEIDNCPECGSPLLVIYNDSNVYAYVECDYGHETELAFLEPYVYGVHGSIRQWIKRN